MTIQELKDNIIKYHISKPILGYYMGNPEALQQLSLEDLITKGYVTQSYYINEIRKEIAKGADGCDFNPTDPKTEVDVEPSEDETTIVELSENRATTIEPIKDETETETVETIEETVGPSENEATIVEQEQATSKPKAKKTTKSKK